MLLFKATEMKPTDTRPWLWLSATTQDLHEQREYLAGWVAMSYDLPLGVGTYHYRGQEFRLLINGQTGKVGGEKPRDAIKLGA